MFLNIVTIISLNKRAKNSKIKANNFITKAAFQKRFFTFDSIASCSLKVIHLLHVTSLDGINGGYFQTSLSDVFKLEEKSRLKVVDPIFSLWMINLQYVGAFLASPSFIAFYPGAINTQLLGQDPL